MLFDPLILLLLVLSLAAILIWGWTFAHRKVPHDSIWFDRGRGDNNREFYTMVIPLYSIAGRVTGVTTEGVNLAFKLNGENLCGFASFSDFENSRLVSAPLLGTMLVFMVKPGNVTNPCARIHVQAEYDPTKRSDSWLIVVG